MWKVERLASFLFTSSVKLSTSQAVTHYLTRTASLTLRLAARSSSVACRRRATSTRVGVEQAWSKSAIATPVDTKPRRVFGVIPCHCFLTEKPPPPVFLLGDKVFVGIHVVVAHVLPKAGEHFKRVGETLEGAREQAGPLIAFAFRRVVVGEVNHLAGVRVMPAAARHARDEVSLINKAKCFQLEHVIVMAAEAVQPDARLAESVNAAHGTNDAVGMNAIGREHGEGGARDGGERSAEAVAGDPEAGLLCKRRVVDVAMWTRGDRFHGVHDFIPSVAERVAEAGVHVAHFR